MILPKSYMKLSPDDRAEFIRNLSLALVKLDKFRYPYILENVQNDESRIQLIEMIIKELYSKSSTSDLEQVFNKIENSLAD